MKLDAADALRTCTLLKTHSKHENVKSAATYIAKLMMHPLLHRSPHINSKMAIQLIKNLSKEDNDVEEPVGKKRKINFVECLETTLSSSSHIRNIVYSFVGWKELVTVISRISSIFYLMLKMDSILEIRMSGSFFSSCLHSLEQKPHKKKHKVLMSTSYEHASERNSSSSGQTVNFIQFILCFSFIDSSFLKAVVIS